MFDEYSTFELDKTCRVCNGTLPDDFEFDCEYCPHCDYAQFKKKQSNDHLEFIKKSSHSPQDTD